MSNNMPNELVKFIINDDRDPVPTDEQVWHLVSPHEFNGARRTLCELALIEPCETFAEVEQKTAARGGITCQACIDIVRKFKAVKL